MAGQSIGRFQIIREIGRGAAAVVYEALDTRINRPVALKVLTVAANLTGAPRRQAVERFHREARSAGKLSHPSIAQIYDVGEDAGRHFIAMELCQGLNLRDMLHFERRIAETRLKAIAIQVLNALEAAHAAGIIHRDIKPENIVVGQNDRIKLTDFGIAKVLSDATMTQTGMMLGTPAYMSPEQVLGKDVDARSDLFSLGAVLYECLSGHKPFEGDSVTAVTHKIAYVDPEPLTGVASPWPEIVMKSLCKAPTNRYQCATDMLSDIRADRAPFQPQQSPQVAQQQVSQTIYAPAPPPSGPATSGAQHVAASGGPVSHQCAHCGTVFGTHLTHCPNCGQPVLPSQYTQAPPPYFQPPQLQPGLHSHPMDVPYEIRGALNWGAFLLPLFWSIAHNVWIGLLCLIPYVGWIMSFVLLFKGNEMAWTSRRFQSVAQFQEVQRIWTRWGVILVIVPVAAFCVIIFINISLVPYP